MSDGGSMQPRAGPSIARGTVVAGAFALIAAISITQTWARVLFVSLHGTDTDRGMITLIAMLLALCLCVYRAIWGLRDRWYYGAGRLAAALSLTLAIWFLADVESSSDEVFGATLVSAGMGLYFTLIATAGYLAALAFQWVSGRGRNALAPDGGAG